MRPHFLAFVETHLRLSYTRVLDEPEQVWDVVIVGAGPHGSTFANKLKEVNPNAKVLVLEKEESPSGHLGQGGNYFRINSTLNNPNRGPCFETKGKYNHPYVSSPIQMTDLSGHRWPSAKNLSILAKIALYNSRAHVLYQQEVVEIIPNEAKIYTVKTRQGKIFKATRVVISTGLGTPKLPKFPTDEMTNLVKSHLNKTETSPILTRENKIMTVAQALARVDVSDPLGEWRLLTDGKVDYPVVLVGFGNSALTFLEFIHSLGPDDCYSYERVQRGALPKIFVIGGGHAQETAEEYQAKSRPRYADISSPIKSAVIRVQSGFLTEIRAGATEGTVEAVYRVSENDVRVITTNRIVLATGYQVSYDHLIPKPGISVITGFPSDAKKSIPIAKQVTGEEIFLVGAACGHDIVDPEYNVNGRVPIKEVGQVEALAFTSILSQEFGRKIGTEIPQRPEDPKEKEARKKVRLSVPPAPAPDASSNQTFGVRLPDDPTHRYLNLAHSADPLACVRLQLAQILSEVDFEDKLLSEVSFDFSVDTEYSQYLRIVAPPAIPRKWLVDRILLSSQLIDALTVLLHDGLQGIRARFPLIADSNRAVLAAGKSEVSLFEVPQGPKQSYFNFPLTKEEQSTKWHNHIDAENYLAVEAIVHCVNTEVPHSQNKIYPIRDLLLCQQVFEPSFSGVYGDLPNFHRIRDAWCEAFTTGKMGEEEFNYEQELATLNAVSKYSPAMSEVEEDLWEAAFDENGVMTVHRNDGDSTTTLDWDRLPGWKEKMIPNVPAYELHHAIDIVKVNPHEKPIDMDVLNKALSYAKFDIGGLFIFKKKGFWAYRTNEFSNESYEQCLEKLKAQAQQLREIVVDLLKKSQTLPEGPFPVYTTACSLEKVHAIWKF